MNNYDKILQACISDDDLRPFMQSSFRINNFSCATNGFLFAQIPLDLVSIKPKEYEEQLTDVSKFNFSSDNCKKFSRKEFLEKIGNWPYNMVRETKPCEACDGDGDVVYEFEYDAVLYEKVFNCPICHGEGDLVIIPVKKIKKHDTEKVFQLSDKYFGYHVAIILQQIFELVDDEFIYVNDNQSDNRLIALKMKNVDLIVCRLYEIDRENLLFNVNLL